VGNAQNRLEVLRAVRTGSGVQLCTMQGEVEAELAFLGAWRWLGRQVGPADLHGGAALPVGGVL
jgi:exopolyphosphatase/guanosine-5'-triphosphate,3'-diphosphate pyrophosphatase